MIQQELLSQRGEPLPSLFSSAGQPLELWVQLQECMHLKYPVRRSQMAAIRSLLTCELESHAVSPIPSIQSMTSPRAHGVLVKGLGFG